MSTKYWGEAITTATCLINRILSSTLGFQTPLSVLHKTMCSPTVSHLQLRVFGCTTFVHLHKPLRNKLEPRALKCIFVGYAQHQKGYRCYHPPTQKLYVTFDVVFHKNIMYYLPLNPQIRSTTRVIGRHVMMNYMLQEISILVIHLHIPCKMEIVKNI